MFCAIHVKQLGRVVQRDLSFHILMLVLKSCMSDGGLSQNLKELYKYLNQRMTELFGWKGH